MQWLYFALTSAVAAAATAVLAKVGVRDVPADLATAIRTCVILAIAWGIAAARGELGALRGVGARTLTFLVLSGIATGISWLAYFRALQLAPASSVAPIDKLSLPLTIVFAFLFLGEPQNLRAVCGVLLMSAGAILTIGR